MSDMDMRTEIENHEEETYECVEFIRHILDYFQEYKNTYKELEVVRRTESNSYTIKTRDYAYVFTIQENGDPVSRSISCSIYTKDRLGRSNYSIADETIDITETQQSKNAFNALISYLKTGAVITNYQRLADDYFTI